MRRRIAIIAAAAAAAVGGALALPDANAAGLCVTYDIDVNGQAQAGTQCTPELPALPALPALP